MENQNIIELQTPIGLITITDGSTKIPFKIRSNAFNIPFEVYDSDNKNTGKQLRADANYTLSIETSAFEIGHIYKIVFSTGNLRYVASDEQTEALAVTTAGWTLGIGMYDPNEDKKTAQFLKYLSKTKWVEQEITAIPCAYDETKFCKYMIEQSADQSGYTFHLLDRTVKNIYFNVAWIKHQEIEPLVYENAIGFWLT